MASGLDIGAAQNFTNQFHGVPAPAPGEAVPNTACQVDPERGGVVSAVKRTGTTEPMPFSQEPFVKTVEGEDIADSDLGLQIAKVEVPQRRSGNHRGIAGGLQHRGLYLFVIHRFFSLNG
jgi:hypothetical protein